MSLSKYPLFEYNFWFKSFFAMKEIWEGIHFLSLGGVNAYLVDQGELTLIDSGYAGKGDAIIQYIRGIGKQESDLKHIVLTHLHSDHAGSAAELKARTGAKVYAHHQDAPMLEEGNAWREEYEVSPGLLSRLVFRFIVKNTIRTVEPVEVDHVISEEEKDLPIGKGFEIIPVPGHARGQIALRYAPYGGVLFAADSMGNLGGLRLSPFYENLKQGYRDLQTLSKHSFQTMVFGHGNPLQGKADEKFRRKLRKILPAEKRA